MRISWEWKLRLINAICQGYFFVFAALTIIVGFNITLPYLYADDAQRLIHMKLLALFLFFNMVANYFYIRLTAKHSLLKNIIKQRQGKSDNGVSGSNGCTNLFSNSELNHLPIINGNTLIDNTAAFITPDYNIGGWTHCKECATFAPPRSKHCPLCDSCILKRDHHCFFAGCCIGFHNQRYFTVFCLYGAIGGFYSSLLTHYYLWYHYDALQSMGIFAYFLPPLLWQWYQGITTGFVVVMAIFFCWNCMTSFICTYYLGVQVFLVCRGQTKYECMKRIQTYKGSIWLNIRSVFGKLWYLRLFIPLPIFDYHGDGQNWDEFMGNKFL